MKPAALQYIASRLAPIQDWECAAAADLVRKALATPEAFERSAQAQHALFHAIWSHITRALDAGDFPSAQADVLDALEAEMAGRVLAIRLLLGWLTKSATAPEDFPALPAFGN